LLAVALEDLAPRRARDASGLRGSLDARRSRRLAEPLLLELAEEQIDGPLDDHREIAVGRAVPQEIAYAIELGLERSAGVEVHAAVGLEEHRGHLRFAGPRGRDGGTGVGGGRGSGGDGSRQKRQ